MPKHSNERKAMWERIASNISDRLVETGQWFERLNPADIELRALLSRIQQDDVQRLAEARKWVAYHN